MRGGTTETYSVNTENNQYSSIDGEALSYGALGRRVCLDLLKVLVKVKLNDYGSVKNGYTIDCCHRYEGDVVKKSTIYLIVLFIIVCFSFVFTYSNNSVKMLVNIDVVQANKDGYVGIECSCSTVGLNMNKGLWNNALHLLDCSSSIEEIDGVAYNSLEVKTLESDKTFSFLVGVLNSMELDVYIKSDYYSTIDFSVFDNKFVICDHGNNDNDFNSNIPPGEYHLLIKKQ